VGKLPIKVPKDIVVAIEGTVVTFKKDSKVKTYDFGNMVEVFFSDDNLFVREKANLPRSVVFSGLHRSNLNNMVMGLAKGFRTILEYNGVGYRAAVAGSFLLLGLGYSHDIAIRIPAGITVTPEKPNLIVIQGDDREAVGNFSSRVISLRVTEPYKGKGIKYKDQVILRKEGKKK
jgi:large subunit ribosomal protein L6